MTKVHVYLNFKDTTEQAFNFYRSAFGGEFFQLQRYKDMPGSELSPADGEKILHIGLPISKETELHGSDVVDGLSPEPLRMGNNVSIMLSPESREEADRLFASLSAGGKISSPMKMEFWGDYFGSFTDKFGVEWLINVNMRS